LLLALEFGEAPWLYFRIHRGRLSAALFSGIVLLGAVCRTLVLGPVAPLFASRTSTSNTLHGHLHRAIALLGWAITPSSRLATTISQFFESDRSIEANESYQRELRRSRGTGASF
jgi:hypothetical protein